MAVFFCFASLILLWIFLLVPTFGIVGAAFSTLISYIAGASLSLFYLEKNLLVKIPSVNIVKSLTCGAVAILIVFSIKQVLNVNPWLELILSASIGFLFYMFFIFFFKAIGKEDLKLLGKVKVKLPNILLRLLNKLAK